MRAAPPAAVPADLLDGISEASPAFPLVGEPPDLRREGWTAAAVFTSASAALAAFEAVLQRMRDAGLCPRPIFFEEMCFQEWQRDEVGARANDPFGEDFEGRQRIGETPPPTGRVRGHGCEGGADAEGGLLLLDCVAPTRSIRRPRSCISSSAQRSSTATTARLLFQRVSTQPRPTRPSGRPPIQWPSLTATRGRACSCPLILDVSASTSTRPSSR